MARELLKIVECEVDSGFAHERDIRTYEIYVGDFVKVISDSANGYWHDRVEYDANDRLNQYGVIQEATILVISDRAYVGHWATITEFYEFLKHYMRATNFFEVVA